MQYVSVLAVLVTVAHHLRSLLYTYHHVRMVHVVLHVQRHFQMIVLFQDQSLQAHVFQGHQLSPINIPHLPSLGQFLYFL